MFAITTSPTWLARTDDFKKVGKKIQKQRQTEVDRIKDKIGDIARDEQRRVKEIFKEHQDIFKKNKEARKTSKKSKSIDLYEK
jgi:vacuolar-type H+-ATPase subunit E/Vma4|tara:strand:- start:3169 stop:3417 length:249 start_codon:yes stop_codon:yes gene_type:complete